MLAGMVKIRSVLGAKQAEIESAVSITADLLQQRGELERQIQETKDALTLLARIAVTEQEIVRNFVSSIVTAGLQDVFNYPYVVEFRESSKANVRVIDVVLLDQGEAVSVPDGVGGGVSQVISVLTQIALVYLLKGSVAQIVILDEVLAHLALQYVPAMGSVLKDVAERLGVQIILVTHLEDLEASADVIYTFERTETGTVVHRRGSHVIV